MKVVASDEMGLQATARLLLAGGVAIIPTDTVYGLAAHPAFPEAVARLYSIKGRAAGKPIALLAAGREAAEEFLGAPLEGDAAALAGRYWPGALTLVLASAKGDSEGLRVPGHEWTRALLARCGGVLRVTSANLSGQMPATDALAALEGEGLAADLLVDDGISPGGEASTVILAMGGELKLLRSGALQIALEERAKQS